MHNTFPVDSYLLKAENSKLTVNSNMEEGSPAMFCVCGWNDAVTAVQLSTNIIFGPVVSQSLTSLLQSRPRLFVRSKKFAADQTCGCQSERLTASLCSFSSYVLLLPVSRQSFKIFSRRTFQVRRWRRAGPVLSHLSPGNNTPLHAPG